MKKNMSQEYILMMMISLKNLQNTQRTYQNESLLLAPKSSLAFFQNVNVDLLMEHLSHVASFGVSSLYGCSSTMDTGFRLFGVGFLTSPKYHTRYVFFYIFCVQFEVKFFRIKSNEN